LSTPIAHVLTGKWKEFEMPGRILIVGFVGVLGLVSTGCLAEDDSQSTLAAPAIVLPPQPAIDIDVNRQIRGEALPGVIDAPGAPLPQPTPLAAALRKLAETYALAPAAVSGPDQPGRPDGAAIASYYGEHDYAPLWIADGHWTLKALAIREALEHAGDDGLDLGPLTIRTDLPVAEEAQAEAEFRLSAAAVAYGRQASGGRIDPAQVSSLIGARPDVADARRVLAALAQADNAGQALRDFNPPHRGYQLLRDKLVEIRKAKPAPAAEPVKAGPILRVGSSDPRILTLRARLGLPSAAGAVLRYDSEIQAAVANFQRTAGLAPSGMLTARTIAALNGWSSQESEIIANMELWRWLPRDLGKDHIEVNIPDFSLAVLHGTAIVHQARVIVGKPENPTPIFSKKMEFLIVNPYWNVPYSIIKKEMLPKLASDPNYFERHGYEVVERGNALIVRQPPGEDNALGRIKFMFPNAYSVYLHDTPSRSLFESDQRALSHGCVRVDQPFKLAEVVLGRDSGWSEERVRRLVGRGERAINLPQPIPIHLMYFTAFVDEYGHLQLRDDLYGYSHRVWAALHPTG
jgi:murein L,D-transpeptidase YcbB/YkuD